MDSRILNFSDFREEILNENSSGTLDPAKAQLQALADQIQKNSDRINQARTNRALSSGPNQQQVDQPKVGDIGSIKAIDLLLATPAGAGLAKLLANNPDYIAQEGVPAQSVSDSPMTVGSVLDRLNKSRADKDQFDNNVESIKAAAEDENAVMEPSSSLLPPSSPYDYGSWSKKRSHTDTDDERWDAVKKALTDEGYKVNTNEVNLIAIRNNLSEKTGHQNHFTDWIIVMNPKKDKIIRMFEATTTPGPLYLAVPFRNWYVAANPDSSINPKGLAIVQPGKYSYKIGSHRGYQALVQDGSVKVHRYVPVASPGDAKYTTYSPGNSESGKFGINIHRADRSGSTEKINSYSAGCFVFEDSRGLSNTLYALEKNKQSKVDVYLLELDKLDSSARKEIESVISSLS
jgi:hypothetical protein